MEWIIWLSMESTLFALVAIAILIALLACSVISR